MRDSGLVMRERSPRSGRRVGRQALITAEVGSIEVQRRKEKLSLHAC